MLGTGTNSDRLAIQEMVVVRPSITDTRLNRLPALPALGDHELCRAVRTLRLALLALTGAMPGPEPCFMRTERAFVHRHYPALVRVLRDRVRTGHVDLALAWKLCEHVASADGSFWLHAVASQVEQRRRCRGLP